MPIASLIFINYKSYLFKSDCKKKFTFLYADCMQNIIYTSSLNKEKLVYHDSSQWSELIYRDKKSTMSSILIALIF